MKTSTGARPILRDGQNLWGQNHSHNFLTGDSLRSLWVSLNVQIWVSLSFLSPELEFLKSMCGLIAHLVAYSVRVSIVGYRVWGRVNILGLTYFLGPHS